jgi:hypothetical protein
VGGKNAGVGISSRTVAKYVDMDLNYGCARTLSGGGTRADPGWGRASPKRARALVYGVRPASPCVAPLPSRHAPALLFAGRVPCYCETVSNATLGVIADTASGRCAGQR